LTVRHRAADDDRTVLSGHDASGRTLTIGPRLAKLGEHVRIEQPVAHEQAIGAVGDPRKGRAGR
jgi:hypothetical protein